MFGSSFRAGVTAVAVAVGAGALVTAEPVTLSTFGWIVNGTVSEVVRAGNYVYLGGSFQDVAPVANRAFGFVSFGPDSAVAELPPLQVDHDVHAIVGDGTGGWIIGGDFTKVGTVSRKGLARLGPDGTLDPSWNVETPGGVYALALHGGLLYVGGNFTTMSGQPRGRLAAVAVGTGAVEAWDPGANDCVRALAVTADSVFVGGFFSELGGEVRQNLGAVSRASGAATSWDPAPGAEVKRLVLDGTTLFAAGTFTTVGGENRDHVAAFDTTSGALLPWNPAIDGQVDDLEVGGSLVYVAGSFGQVGGESRHNVAAVDKTGGAVQPWAPEVNDSVLDLALDGSTVFMVGAFTEVEGATRLNAAAVDTAGNLLPWNPSLNDEARLAVKTGSFVHVAGSFHAYGAIRRSNLVAVDLETNALLPWNPGTNGWVHAVETNGHTVYVGGAFNSVGEEERSGVAAVDAFSGAVVDWDPSPNGAVKGLLLADGVLYLAGEFDKVGGTTRNRLAAVDIVTGALGPWNPNAGGGGAEALALAGDTVYVGGKFTSMGGETRHRLAALHRVTGAPLPWNPSVSGGANAVYKVDALNGVVYAGGDFSAVNSMPRSSAAAIDAVSGALTPWAPEVGGPVYDIDAIGDRVYLAGGFGSVDGSSRPGIALVGTNGTLSEWSPDDLAHGNQVSVIDAHPDAVLFGGNVYSSLDHEHIGAVLYPEELTMTAPSAPMDARVVMSGTVARLGWTRPALGGVPNNYVIEGGSGAGLSNLARVATGNASTTFTTPPLPPGQYYFRVRAGNAGGVGQPSTEQAFVVGALGCTAPPPPPMNVVAVVSDHNVTLSWENAPGGRTSGYQVEAGTSPRAIDITVSDIGLRTTLTVGAPEGAYWLRVRGYNACGLGLPSGEQLLRVGTPRYAGPPLELAATVNGSTVELSWLPPAYGAGPFQYVLEAGTRSGLSNAGRTTVPVTLARYAGVPAGVYFVRVRAVNALGTGPASNEVIVVVR
jgi:hypothetical protein